MPEIRAERLTNLTELATAMERVGLPTADLDQPGRVFFRFMEAGRTLGYGGLEGGEPDMLLRSVAADAPGQADGGRIVAALEREAAALGATKLHLLTNTAARFFQARGYTAADRATAPEPIRDCEQFRSLCPASAAYLVKPLSP